MSWAIKVKLLENQGMSREQALEQIVQELAEQNRVMDLKLAKCMDHMPLDAVKEIFGDSMP